MRGSMSWNDTVKAAGLAALAGRTSTTASNAIDTRRDLGPARRLGVARPSAARPRRPVPARQHDDAPLDPQVRRRANT